jgi:hypothetical protein
MKTINICLFIFTILIIIFSIYNNLINSREKYVNYHASKIQENCLDYIATKKWSVDYGLNYSEDEAGTVLKEKHMKDRLGVISELTTVKSPQYSILETQYAYSDACLLQKANLNLYDTSIDTCMIKGKALSKDNINKFGRKNIINKNVQLYTPDKFAKVATLDVSNMIPNKGCIIDTRNKDDFFKLIDELVSIKKFEKENIINVMEAEKNKGNQNYVLEKKITKEQQDKINELNTFINKTEILEKCRNITTSPTDNGNGSLDYLSNHHITCAPNEVLQKVKLSTTSIPYKNIRYHKTKNNAFLLSNKDPKASELLNFLKVNPTAKFRIINLTRVDDSRINKCTEWGCTCQGFSDKFRTGHNQGWGHCPNDGTGQWWINNKCTTVPITEETPCNPWGCTCQGMSDLYGTWAGKSWGDALNDHLAQKWWVDNKCNTKPNYNELCKPWGCTCQGVTDKYKTRHNITWGKATDMIKKWWIGNSCNSRNVTEIIYDSTQLYSFAGVEELNNQFSWITYADISKKIEPTGNMSCQTPIQNLLPAHCVADFEVIIGNGEKIFYSSRCCSINTNIGDNVRFAMKSNNNQTTKINPKITSNIWDARSLYSESNTIKSGPKCSNNLLNGYRFVKNANPKTFNYNYSCSDIENDILKINPNKKITKTCSKHFTEPSKIINGKTTEMTNMNIECPPKSYISDIKLNKNGDTYRTEYMCCKPTIN